MPAIPAPKQPSVKRSNRGRAHRSPTTHAFVPGQGYLDYGGPPLANPGPHPAVLANPPQGARDGSYHFLIAPGGAKRLAFVWLAAHKAWGRKGGLRAAFRAEYLSRAGWVYQGAANGPDDK